MKLLFCSSECTPLVKIGGLGDVSAALPKALSELGVDVRVAIPLYNVVDRGKFPLEKVTEISVPFANKEHLVAVYQTVLPGSEVVVLLFENEEYLSGGGEKAFTGLEDEIRRFSFFDRAVVCWLKAQESWHPDVIHLNDWHTGLVPRLLKEELDDLPATLFTIHNLSYQGIASLDLFAETGLSIDGSKVLSWDAEDDNIDLLLQGIATADILSTVSPIYAREILTSEFGEGLNEVLKSREGRLFGVLNGVDTKSFDPETDGDIFKKYSLANWREGKAENKKKLQEELGLPPTAGTPLLAFIGRLEPKQKGLDLIEAAWKRVRKEDLQFVLLGTGSPEWEEKFRKIGKKSPQKFSAQIEFDTGLARRILAGADMLLMPSKFEPCGLPQMMAMRYGTVPIVRAVGGLADTVREGENGFTFEKYDAKALVSAVRRAVVMFEAFRISKQPRQGKTFKVSETLKVGELARPWEKLVENGMKGDYSWARSAEGYLKLYRKALSYRYGVGVGQVGEVREDSLTDEWVVVSGGRKKRPGELDQAGATGKFEGCPFEEGNEDRTPSEVLRIGRGAPNGPGWEVRVIPNKFPILSGHEVIIHSPDHEKDIAQLPLEQVERIVQAYVSRSRHYDEKGFPYIFNNYGPASGASLTHPHSQLIVFGRLPEAVLEEIEKAEAYYRQNESCSYCDLIKREEGGERWVFENSHFVVVTPYASEWPYEMLVLPKHHRANFSDIEEGEITALADVLKKVCGVLTRKFEKDLSYNFWIHSISSKFLSDQQRLYYHWHLEIIPRAKKLGGIELGAKVMIYDHGTPESAAKELRGLFEV